MSAHEVFNAPLDRIVKCAGFPPSQKVDILLQCPSCKNDYIRLWIAPSQPQMTHFARESCWCELTDIIRLWNLLDISYRDVI